MHTSTRTLVCGWAERCHVVPSPLVGEGQGGGYNTHYLCFVSAAQQMQACCRYRVFLHRTNFALVPCRHPSPCPSPTRGEGTVWHAPSHLMPCACGTFQRSVHALAPARGRQRQGLCQGIPL